MYGSDLIAGGTDRKQTTGSTVSTDLPSMPDFKALDKAALETADHRTRFLALIGNLVFSWSNNESLLIYVLMILLKTDQFSAAVVFATLNTTRARLDLIQRLAKLHLRDRVLGKKLAGLIERFNECTRVRNEFNHCMYTVDEHGEITQTQSMRVVESRKGLQFGEIRAVDDARIKEMTRTIQELKKINREIWQLFPELKKHLESQRATSDVNAAKLRR